MIADIDVSVADEIRSVEHSVSANVDATTWSNDECRSIVSTGRIPDRECGIALRVKRRESVSGVDVNLFAQMYVTGAAARAPVVLETTQVARRNQICSDVLVHRSLVRQRRGI